MNIYYYITIGLFAAFALADTIYRARKFPNIRYWRVIGIAATIAAVGVSIPISLAAAWCPLNWLRRRTGRTAAELSKRTDRICNVQDTDC